jgi:hypothetical protein
MVENSSDSGTGSLPYVIANASSGDTIEFDMSSGHVTSPITLANGTININKSLAIEGPGAPFLTISGESNNLIFNVTGSANVAISNLTFANGYGSVGGAISHNGGNLNLDDDVFESNQVTDSGGAIFNNGGTLAMSGCYVSDNKAPGGTGGGVLVLNGVVTIESSTFVGNQAAYHGGAFMVIGGNLNVIDSTLVSNSAGYDGGGLYLYSGNVRLLDCTIADNTASTGGGVDTQGNLTMANTLVADNSATSGGPDFVGNLNTDDGSNLIGNDQLTGNGFSQSSDQLNVNPILGSLGNYGGPTETIPLEPGSPAIDAGTNSAVPTGMQTDQRGFYRFANGTTDIGAFETQVYVVTNTADSGGGSLRAALTNANVAGSSMIDVATIGTIGLESSLPVISADVDIIGPGANRLNVSGQDSYQSVVISSGVTASISGLSFISSGNHSGAAGVQNSGTLTLRECSITASTNGDDGGGINNAPGATLTLLGCTVSGNTSANDGGGINNSGTLTVVNSTIANNRAPAGTGGGINNAGSLTVVNSTIAGNLAFDGGGIEAGGTVSLANTIVADNTTDGGTGPDFVGSVTTDQGNNLIGDPTGSAGLTGESDLLGINPLLANLNSYGAASETMPLLPGSPAIDAGNNALASYDSTALATDQRGFARVRNGTVDIGADECQGFSVSVASGDNQSAVTGTNFADSLNVVVSSSAGEPVAGGVVTYSPPVSGPSTVFPGGSDTAAISAIGIASMTAAANGTMGSYSVTASASGDDGTASFKLTNDAAPATQLAFESGPATTVYGDTINGMDPGVTVEVQDQNGDLVSDSTAPVTIMLDNDPTSAILGGTLTVNAKGGIATFSTLSINKVGTRYTLEATSSGLTATPASGSFDITPRPITITPVANSKTYDGTKTASATPVITAGTLASGDVADFYETYGPANVGTGLSLLSGGIVQDGNNGNNYDYTYVGLAIGTITPEPLTITAIANIKVYDATTSASTEPLISSGSLQGSDSAEFSEAYSNSNAGTALTLTPSGSVNDGNNGDNYSYTFVPVATGVITPALLTISAVTNVKEYDGTVSAAAMPTVSGLRGSDTATNLSETYNTPAAGTGKTLNVAMYTINDGNGGNNYAVKTAANRTGVILPPGAAHLAVHTEPSTAATAGQVFATQPVIYVVDASGNLDTSDNTTVVTVSILSGSGPLWGTTSVKVSGGIATFNNLQDNSPGTIVLLFSATTSTATQANPVTVIPPPPAPPVTHTPPAIVRIQTTGGHGQANTIVLHLNQAIRSKPKLPLSIFSLEARDTHGIFDKPVRIAKASYNARARTITLAVGRPIAVRATFLLVVRAAGIVNQDGQELAGDGPSGTDFMSLIPLG